MTGGRNAVIGPAGGQLEAEGGGAGSGTEAQRAASEVHGLAEAIHQVQRRAACHCDGVRGRGCGIGEVHGARVDIQAAREGVCTAQRQRAGAALHESARTAHGTGDDHGKRRGINDAIGGTEGDAAV